MQAITTVGLNIAKSVFQVHGVDAAGQVVTRRQLKRRYVLTFFQKPPPCLVGIEARLVTPLVARAQGARLYGAIDATGLSQSQGARVSASRLHQAHVEKAMQSRMISPGRL